MGFMDKAKKLADQAQQKLDEAQKQFNDRQAGGARRLVLWTDEANAAARAFYERRGWRLDRVDGAELRYRLDL